MNKSIHISLRAGESVYVNGAILRVDRKTSLEFLNDVTFLLGSHFLEEHQATTPLRKMYFQVQKLLTEPTAGFTIRQSFYEIHTHLIAACDDDELSTGLGEVKALINTGRNFEALKMLRKLFTVEAGFLARLEQLEQQAQSEPVKIAANQRR